MYIILVVFIDLFVNKAMTDLFYWAKFISQEYQLSSSSRLETRVRTAGGVCACGCFLLSADRLDLDTSNKGN